MPILLTASNLTEVTIKVSNSVMEGETKDLTKVICLIAASIIITSVASPFMILLNVLVITAVKKRPRLETKGNILLACLAVTDALTGLMAQPSLALWHTSLFYYIALLLGNSDFTFVAFDIHRFCLIFLLICSCLHLMLVVFERLVAIKFPFRYLFIVTMRNPRGGGGTPIWNRRGCLSEILNLTPKGDHLGVAQALYDP